FSGVALPPVPGRTTTSVDNGPGKARLVGNVVGPEGGVPGATVHVERLVGDTVLATDVASNLDGTWQVNGVKGGRYRVRGWRAPDLALVGPVVFFLNGDETRTISLALGRYGGNGVAASLA